MKVIQNSMNWIKKHFLKKEYNYQNMEQIMEANKETTKDVIKYQWKKGDDFGKIVEFQSKDEKFTYFTDGSKIFNNIINEFLEKFEGDKVPFPGLDSEPRILRKDLAEFKEDVIDAKKEVKKTESPFEQLISKLSAKNIEKFETSINLNIPKKDVFEMLVNNADEDKEELIDTIAKVAISQIEINKLQEYLKAEVITFIKKYYNE
jgi:hypothetical protein